MQNTMPVKFDYRTVFECEIENNVFVDEKLDLADTFIWADKEGEQLEEEKEYWAVISLYQFFRRLAPEYQTEEVKTAMEYLGGMVEKLTDDQIREAIGCFNPKAFTELMEGLSTRYFKGEYDVEAFFLCLKAWFINLDDYGMVLAYARDRDLISCMESPEWSDFETCYEFVTKVCNGNTLNYMQEWISSFASLINPDLFDTNESLFLQSNLWYDWLECLLIDKQMFEFVGGMIEEVVKEVSEFADTAEKPE